MVAVVQLVEHQVVILGVAGSSPVSHPYRWEGIYALPPFSFPSDLAPLAQRQRHFDFRCNRAVCFTSGQ